MIKGRLETSKRKVMQKAKHRRSSGSTNVVLLEAKVGSVETVANIVIMGGPVLERRLSDHHSDCLTRAGEEMILGEVSV